MPIKLRDVDEFMRKAAQIKVNIQSRKKALSEVYAQLIDLKINKPNDNTGKIETLENQFEFLSQKNKDDIYLYAVLYWALGLSDDIDINKLDV